MSKATIFDGGPDGNVYRLQGWTYDTCGKSTGKKLLEMIDAVNEEGRKTSNELVNEAVFGLMKMMGQ